MAVHEEIVSLEYLRIQKAKSNNEMLPIHCAAANSRSVEVVQALLEAGDKKAQLIAKQTDGLLPIHLAVRHNRHASLKRMSPSLRTDS